jgi:D-lactate dehydratase
LGLITYFPQTYSENRGHNFVLNALFDEVNADDYCALVIPGGRAPEYLSLDESVLNLVQKLDAEKKVIASICHGQLILAAAGVLKVNPLRIHSY